VRIKAIMLGAIAALGMATLTANANTTATRQESGSLVSLVAATTTVTKAADREVVAAAARSTASEKATEPSEEPVVAAIKSVAPRPAQVSAACQQAMNALKAMRQADAQQWKQALLAARTACMPQPAAACQAALSSLQALLPGNRPEELSDLVKLPTPIDLTALRAAFAAVATACGHRD
jgi:hypothetical protein